MEKGSKSSHERFCTASCYTPLGQKLGIWTAPKPRGSTIAKGVVLPSYYPFCDRRTAGAFAQVQIQVFGRGGYKTAQFDYLQFLQEKMLRDGHIPRDKIPALYDYLENPELRESLLAALATSEPTFYVTLQSLCIRLTNPAEKQNELIIEIGNLLRGMEEPVFTNDIAQFFTQHSNDLVLVDSDDPQDLFLCGTEVGGSCQHIEGDPENNRALMGYVLDGKNRLIAAKDESGKIVARMILSMLLDSHGDPVLFLEPIYPQAISDEIAAALEHFAFARARELGLSLMSKVQPKGFCISGEEYALRSLGSPAPYEYRDSNRGIQEGPYTINGVRMWSPKGVVL